KQQLSQPLLRGQCRLMTAARHVGRHTLWNRARECERATPLPQPARRKMSVEVLVIERVSEGLQTVDARTLARSHTALGDMDTSSYDVAPAFAALLEEPRATGHGVIEKTVHQVLSWPRHDEELEIVAFHL